jgi:hypothetical protein
MRWCIDWMTHVDRPVHQDQPRVLTLQAGHRPRAPVGGAVVHDPEDPSRLGIGRHRHDLGHQPIEGGDAGLRLAPAEELGPVDIQGGHVRHSRSYSCSTFIGCPGCGGRVAWQRTRAWMLVFSSADRTNSSSRSG